MAGITPDACQVSECLLPKPSEIEKARKEFKKRFPDAVIYPISRCLLEQARSDDERAAAVMLFLLIWNNVYYCGIPIGKRGAEMTKNFIALRDKLLPRFDEFYKGLSGTGCCDIEALTDEHRTEVERVFAEFCEELHPVGAAKALHLLAPNLFLIWDNDIATLYGFPRPQDRKVEPQEDAQRYWQFVQKVKCQVKLLREKYGERLPKDLLKALDEWNMIKGKRLLKHSRQKPSTPNLKT